MVAAEEGAQGTPPKGASTRIARVALEALAFPSKWTGFGGLSAQVSAAKSSMLRGPPSAPPHHCVNCAQAIKERQHGLAAWLNGVLDLVAENVTAEELAAFLRPVETVEALWTEAGPLGVNFAKDLTVLATSPATQKTHPQLVPGLELVSVQNTTVVGGAYAATIELLRTAGRPLTLVLVDRSATTPSVDRVEVTSASSGSDDSGKDFVAFTVRCFSSQRGTWVLTKRFSEFSALRDCLLRDAAEASPPSVDRLKGLLHLGAATTAEPSIALYVCTRKTIARTSCELDSEPLQAVYPGDELEAVEVRENGDGAVRIRCRLRDADLLWGWCTATNKDGLVICESLRSAASRTYLSPIVDRCRMSSACVRSRTHSGATVAGSCGTSDNYGHGDSLRRCQAGICLICFELRRRPRVMDDCEALQRFYGPTRPPCCERAFGTCERTVPVQSVAVWSMG